MGLDAVVVAHHLVLFTAPRKTTAVARRAQTSRLILLNSQYLQVLGDFEDGLEEAALIAQEYTTWLSHMFCSQFDGTAAEAAKALNDGWCKTWNERELSNVGLKCSAASEVFGFGRSRVTCLVIRVYRK
mmetsp:Transcript_14102/g.25546  ORF Transcript_14102/g.25546 Transcript_14102/m.25546 type:complete len:129 (-) Transcript_14102:920-1306(-)